MLRIHDAMANSKKIIINAISFIDLQLKLAKRPSWRILEISRLNFGFKAILQKKTTEERRRPPDTASHRALINKDTATRHRSSL
jgi:hypothetical protein